MKSLNGLATPTVQTHRKVTSMETARVFSWSMRICEENRVRTVTVRVRETGRVYSGSLRPIAKTREIVDAPAQAAGERK